MRNIIMKKKLLNVLASLREQDINLLETPALYTFSYEEEPYIQFQVLIKATTQSNLAISNELH